MIRGALAAGWAGLCLCAAPGWGVEIPCARTALSVYAPAAGGQLDWSAMAPSEGSSAGAAGPREPAAQPFAPLAGSRLALPALAAGEQPELLLAQRSIEREWGPAEESTYVEVDVPGWRSPSLAMGLSAAVPGAGQIYSGESSGWLYAALEAASWATYAVFRSKGNDLKDDARTYAGNPYDPNARWSFQTYRDSTGQSSRDLEALYAADPDVFYDVIGRNDGFLKGWNGDAGGTRARYASIWNDANADFQRARYTVNFIWLHHVLSAFDALRAARIHNLPLEHNLNIKLRTSWRRDGPDVALTLERSF